MKDIWGWRTGDVEDKWGGGEMGAKDAAMVVIEKLMK